MAPPNGKYAIGAATPMFTPTIDALACFANSRAALPLDVKMDVAFAFGCALTSEIASSSVLTGVIDATGPKNRCAAGWVAHGGETWFFKLTGPDALVGAEKAKFTAFLESVRFNKPE